MDYQAIYEPIWESIPWYRKQSPGERDCLVEFLGRLKPEWSVLDAGCGTGRAAICIWKAGHELVMVDVAENCLDEAVAIAADVNETLRFKQINLTMPVHMLLPLDVFFCTDVMEHFEEADLDQVLTNLRDMTTRGGYFQIYQLPHEVNGVELHLTQRPARWWLELLGGYWSEVEVVRDDLTRVVFCVGEMVRGD